MDLRAYYRGIRELESNISSPFVVVISLNTADGGKEGRSIETSRALAARLIVDGRGRLASQEEAQAFHEAHAAARDEAEAKALAQRMQVTLVPAADVRASKIKASKD